MRLVSVLLPMLALAGCASAPMPPVSAPTPKTAPEPFQTPDALKPPAGQAMYLEAHASGVQIYDCIAAEGGGFAWKFRAPEATLVDRDGKALGKHYAGPTWEGLDGSRVVGEVKASAPGPTPATAIPWLLLASKSNSGTGVFAEAKSIQRVSTGGGVAPQVGLCTAAGQDLRVSYTATYYFYR